MEEYQQTEQPSVNTGEVAETQQTETQTQTQEISANNSEVANPNPVQNAETNAHYADMRRKQELDQYRQQAETYQQQFNHMAQLMGYQSQEELMNAVQQYEEQQQRAQYEQAGIDPDLLNQAIEQHPAVQYAKQMEQQQQSEAKFNQEANELFSEFPDLKPEEIPPEAFQLQQERGLRLVDAYKITTYSAIGQKKEQEAIQKLQNNALSTPGSLGAGGEPQTKSVSNMSKSEFENLIQRVKRGERVEL